MSKKTDPHSSEHPRHPDHDEFVVVPQGRSKRQFLFTFGLMVFVLLIFTVGGSFQSTVGGLFGGGGRDVVEVGWADPLTGETPEGHQREFLETGDLLRSLARVGLFIPWHGEARRGPEEEDVALFLILEQIAADEGIALSDSEFKEELTMVFAGPPKPGEDEATRRATASQNLRRARQGSRVPQSFELGIRRVWTVRKLIRLMRLGLGEVAYDSMVRDVPNPQLLQFGYALPNRGDIGAVDPERVRRIWEKGHVQYHFQYIRARADAFEDEARQALPGDEELLAWFHEQPPAEQRKHYTEQEYRVEAAYLPLDPIPEGFDETALLEAYPAPEGADPERLLTTYYNLARLPRFKVAQTQDESEGGEADDSNEQEPATPSFKPLEEVREQCEREAALHRALGSWLRDLQEQATAAKTEPAEGEPPAPELDFKAEAERYGLEFVESEPLTRDEIEAQDWAGTFVGQRFDFRPQGGSFLPSVVIEKDSLVIIYVSEVIEPREPEFAEIRDAVADAWVQAHALEMARQALDDLRDAFGTRPEDDPATEAVDESQTWIPTTDAEAFRAAAESAGLEMQERDWLEQFEVSTGDFDTMTPADRVFRAEQTWYGLEPGSVPPPALVPAAFQKEESDRVAILARFDGQRPKPLSEMTAADLMQVRQQALDEAATALEKSVLRVDSDWFKQSFQVHLDAWVRRAEADAKAQEEAPPSE